MKIKNKKSNKILLIIFFLASLLIICIGIMIYYNCIDKTAISQKQLEYINGDEWKGEHYPDGMPNLYRNYSGSLTCQNIGKSFDYVVNTVIPQYVENLRNSNENQIIEYFENNKDTIGYQIGLTNKEDFCELIQKIQISVKTDIMEFEKFYIDSESVDKRSNVTKTDLYVKYKDCDELVLNIRINGSKISNLSSVQYK